MPFDAIATSNGYAPPYDVRQYLGRFSPDDQKKLDKAYQHWLDSCRKHDCDDIANDEGKMQELMARYHIPREVPYEALHPAVADTGRNKTRPREWGRFVADRGMN